MDEILERILGIESEARAIVSEAQELATLLKVQAQEEAEEQRVRARQQAEEEAQDLRRRVEQEVDREQARILSQADRESEPVEKTDRFDQAADYIVDAVSVQGAGEV